MDSKQKITNNYNPASTDRQEELLCEVTQSDELIGPVTRRACHNETTRPWHRSTHIYLFDPAGNLYLSQRSYTKDTAAGLWTVTAGGHVKFNKTYEETAKTELEEELGLQNVPLKLVDKISIDYGSEREIIAIFTGTTKQKPKANRNEVEQLKSFNLEKLRHDFLSGKFDLSGGSRDSFRHVFSRSNPTGF